MKLLGAPGVKVLLVKAPKAKPLLGVAPEEPNENANVLEVAEVAAAGGAGGAVAAGGLCAATVCARSTWSGGNRELQSKKAWPALRA